MNRVIPLLLIISFAIAEIGRVEAGRRRVLWQSRTNIGDAANWEDERIPCASDALLFPQQGYDLIKLSNFSMRELILPKSGGFILDTQTSLNFRERDPKCGSDSSGRVKAFKSVVQSAWLSASNWQTTRGGEVDYAINAATPHDERIPCDNDDIVFPVNNSYVVDLQSMPLLTFASIAIDGRLMTPSEFRDFLFTSAAGQASFKNFDNTQFIDGSDTRATAAVCHLRGVSLRQQLCENERPFCQPTPHCSESVTPLGHCCPVCGAVFQMRLDNNGVGFDLTSFRSSVEKATSADDRASVVYHSSVTLGRGKEARQPFLQLIIVDRYEYNERSARLMHRLRESLLNGLSPGQSKVYLISGTAFTPNASGHVLAFILGPLLLVALFMALIYAVYYDDRHIPRLMAAIRNRRLMHQSNVIFARFDNSASRANLRSATDDEDDVDGGGGGGSGSVVEVDLHFGTDQSIEDVNRAFSNPMFDAKAAETKGSRDNDSDNDGVGGSGSGIKEEKL